MKNAVRLGSQIAASHREQCMRDNGSDLKHVLTHNVREGRQLAFWMNLVAHTEA